MHPGHPRQTDIHRERHCGDHLASDCGEISPGLHLSVSARALVSRFTYERLAATGMEVVSYLHGNSQTMNSIRQFMSD
jgi:hypothetical protein